jgi:hypothetical protein
MNQSLLPKKAFQQTTFAKTLETLVTTDGFRQACGQSLLHYLDSLSTTDNETEAAANWHRIEGAKKVIDTLLNLAEAPPNLEPKADYNLK